MGGIRRSATAQALADTVTTADMAFASVMSYLDPVDMEDTADTADTVMANTRWVGAMVAGDSVACSTAADICRTSIPIGEEALEEAIMPTTTPSE
jgi:hypothetical protein